MKFSSAAAPNSSMQQPEPLLVVLMQDSHICLVNHVFVVCTVNTLTRAFTRPDIQMPRPHPEAHQFPPVIDASRYRGITCQPKLPCRHIRLRSALRVEIRYNGSIDNPSGGESLNSCNASTRQNVLQIKWKCLVSSIL